MIKPSKPLNKDGSEPRECFVHDVSGGRPMLESFDDEFYGTRAEAKWVWYGTYFDKYKEIKEFSEKDYLK